MLYQINKGTVHFGVNDVFEDIQFDIKGTEKIAVVGRNGCGKSTLLKVICGELELNSGTIHSMNGIKIGYLAQTTFSDENITVDQEMNKIFEHIFKIKDKLDACAKELENSYSDELLEKYAEIQLEFEMHDGYSYRQEMETILTRFGFSKDDLKRKINTFSGGQKTRLAFVKLLISKPDILLLDEPTNHLDLSTIEWLENYLRKYPRAVVLVSHDRYFLDSITEVIYEIEYSKMSKYTGNYTSYLTQKKADLIKQQSAFSRQQKEIDRLENLIEKFRYKKSKAAFAQSKIKYLDRMDRIEQVQSPDSKSFNAHFVPKIKGGKEVLINQDLQIGYDSVLTTIDLEIRNNDKICIMGDNGTGKSTFLKTIMGLIPKLGGNYLFGHQIEIGYFDQGLAQIDSNKTVLEEIWDEYPEYDHTEIRKVLGSFLFTADDVFKSVTVLSGGEKVRLYFAKLVLKQPNLLILDEPTNHLDIEGKEALEEALNGYSGTIIFVSHDRYFIKKIAKSCLVLENGEAKHYKYGYKEFIDYKKEEEVKVKKEKVNVKEKRSQSSSTKNQIKKTEKKIEELEILLEEKRELRYDENYYHDFRKMNELNDLIDQIVNQLETNMKLWEELSEE
jgi:ATP-binding cassette subfamily F protein 3